jgi:hypothetical protein
LKWILVFQMYPVDLSYSKDFFCFFLRVSVGGSGKGGCGVSDVVCSCVLRVNEVISFSDLMEVYVWLYVFCIVFCVRSFFGVLV